MNRNKKNIIWLASYPKSGNTWVRIFLQSILSNAKDENTYLSLSDIPIVSNRFLIDQYLGVNSSDLTDEEIHNLRPDIYREVSKHSDRLKVLKVHDAYGYTSSGSPLFPPEITRSAVYIIRNPLDVAVSYAFHGNVSMDESILRMNNSECRISKNDNLLKAQVTQYLGSWSDHVNSWIKQDFLPVHLIRFEDLLSDPKREFSNLLDTLEINCSNSAFEKALFNCDFATLQALEKNQGFKEKPLQAANFFREGKAGKYPDYLSENQIQSVINEHQDLMSEFGYLNKK